MTLFPDRLDQHAINISFQVSPYLPLEYFVHQSLIGHHSQNKRYDLIAVGTQICDK